MHSIAIVALCIAMAVIYGIVHDQVTARVCVEYFTIGHPPVFDTDSPTLLGLGWGIIATWWVGEVLGYALAARGTRGSTPQKRRPFLGPADLPPFARHGYLCIDRRARRFWAGNKWGGLPVGATCHRRALPRHARFLADLWAHSASYLVGFVGGIVVIVRVWAPGAANLLVRRQVVLSQAPCSRPFRNLVCNPPSSRHRP